MIARIILGLFVILGSACITKSEDEKLQLAQVSLLSVVKELRECVAEGSLSGRDLTKAKTQIRELNQTVRVWREELLYEKKMQLPHKDRSRIQSDIKTTIKHIRETYMKRKKT